MWNRIIAVLRWTATKDTLLSYFISMLEIRVKLIEPYVGDVQKVILAQIQADLSTFSAKYGHLNVANGIGWNEAYRLERLLALLEPKNNLVSEIERRISEAEELKMLCAERLRSNFVRIEPIAIDTKSTTQTFLEGGEFLLRSLLLDILEELHWDYQRKFYARSLHKSATYKIAIVGMTALVAFLTPYVFIYWELNSTNKPSFESLSGLPMYTALTAGLFGAFFSRLLYLQNNWNGLTLAEMLNARSYWLILLRGCVGMSGAIIVYFFLQSGVLQSDLIPKFEKIGLKNLNLLPTGSVPSNVIQFWPILPNEALALLVVWSFLAGFSERLVLSVLQSTETKIAGGSPNKN